jgi:hypothetical protein
MSDTARLPPRWVVRLAWVVHRAIYRVTGGRRGLAPATPSDWGTMRVLTVGRRSGAERPVILGYFEDGDDLVTMAMNGWADPEPAWWLNLPGPAQRHRRAEGRNPCCACPGRRRRGTTPTVGSLVRVQQEP